MPGRAHLLCLTSKKKPKNFYYHPQKQSLKTTKNPNQSLNPINQFIHTTSKKNHCKYLAEFAKKSNRYLNKKNSYSYPLPPSAFLYYLLLHKSVLQECFYDCYKDLDHLQLGNYFYHESLANKFAKFKKIYIYPKTFLVKPQVF